MLHNFVLLIFAQKPVVHEKCRLSCRYLGGRRLVANDFRIGTEFADAACDVLCQLAAAVDDGNHANTKK